MYVIISSSPNKDGLTAACAQAAVNGILSAGGEAQLYDISQSKLSACRICGDGWGLCRSQGRCINTDILGELQARIAEAEGVILVTPVYWQQPSERMKYFLDRFRRCEAFKGDDSAAAEKPIHLIAAAGGSGNGTATCLAELEMWCRHVRATACERIGVTRYNREQMLDLIFTASAKLCLGEYTRRG